MKQSIVLEVCTGRLDDALAALDAGADRIEFCSGLELDGLTPSLGTVKQLRQATAKPIVALVRSRPGDFIYSPPDIAAMIQDCNDLLEAGANAVAIGFLNAASELDIESLAELADRIGGENMVIHRAFDVLADPIRGLEQLVWLGIKRILTSGGGSQAVDCLAALRGLMTAAAGRIEILPAGGVSPDNAMEILSGTGATQLHGSFRSNTPSSRTFLRLDPVLVKRTREVLDQYNLKQSHHK